MPVGEPDLPRLPHDIPQHSVHETGEAVESRPSREAHGLVENGMVGNALEKEELIEGKSQDVPYISGNRLEAFRQKKRR